MDHCVGHPSAPGRYRCLSEMSFDQALVHPRDPRNSYFMRKSPTLTSLSRTTAAPSATASALWTAPWALAAVVASCDRRVALGIGPPRRALLAGARKKGGTKDRRRLQPVAPPCAPSAQTGDRPAVVTTPVGSAVSPWDLAIGTARGRAAVEPGPAKGAHHVALLPCLPLKRTAPFPHQVCCGMFAVSSPGQWKAFLQKDL
mmetsp:Transcript_13463/g.28129  ORF Transcript_13463/g.28129 Transcript_13463/m.28129 type:complete len:201 (-) Transcript_13463:80-682(-)